MPALYLITGVSASGKFTVAQLLAERFERGVHVRGDSFRRMVVNGAAPMTPPLSPDAWAQLRLRHRLAVATGDGFVDAGFTAVVQDVMVGPVLQVVVDLVRSRPCHVIVLSPNAEVVAAREAGRSKVAYGPGSFTIEMLDHALRNETPRIGHWIDSSEQTPDETVDTILAATSS